MRIIIVEGIDRVGKTTLVNKIVRELGFIKYHHMELYDKINSVDHEVTEIVETEKILSTLSALITLKGKDINIIFDRFHISEYVYGSIERGYKNESISKFDKMLAELGATLILVKPTDIESSSKQHGKNLKEYSSLFNECVENSLISDKIVCNYNNLNNVVLRLKEDMKHDLQNRIELL